MAFSDTEEQASRQSNQDRRKQSDPHLSQVIKDIISNVKDLERKNKELEERNANLLDALAQANEQIARLECSIKSIETAKATLETAIQMLGNAEGAIQAIQNASRNENTIRYETAAKRATQLHQEAISILEEAREKAALRTQEADKRAIEIIVNTRRSILSMIEALDGSSPVQPVQADEPAPPVPAENPTEETAMPFIETRLIELVASPFRSFAALSAFQNAVRQLPGVVKVRPRRFDDKGALHLTVEHADNAPLADKLSQLPQFNLRLSSVADDRIEITILD